VSIAVSCREVYEWLEMQKQFYQNNGALSTWLSTETWEGGGGFWSRSISTFSIEAKFLLLRLSATEGRNKECHYTQPKGLQSD
jgi:hypothetical protein